MNRRLVILVVGILLLVGGGIGAFIILGQDNSDPKPITLPGHKEEEKDTGPSNNSNNGERPAAQLGPVSVPKRDNWTVRRFASGENFQATLQYEGEVEPSGIILYGPSPAADLDGLVSVQIGNPSLYADSNPPKVSDLKIAGRNGKMVTLPLGSQTRVVGVLFVKPDRALVIVMTGPSGGEKLLRDRLRGWSQSITIR